MSCLFRWCNSTLRASEHSENHSWRCHWLFKKRGIFISRNSKSVGCLLHITKHIVNSPAYSFRMTWRKVVQLPELFFNWTIDFFFHLLRLEDLDCLSGKTFLRDLHLQDLLVFSAKTDFHDHFLYKAGHIILQDKVKRCTSSTFVCNTQNESNLMFCSVYCKHFCRPAVSLLSS